MEMHCGHYSAAIMAEKHALSDYQAYAESGYENGQFKRQKVDPGAFQQITYSVEGTGSPHFTEPSPVVHARGVADEAREPDLLHALGMFGNITCVTMMPKIRQALIEFEDISSARRLMEYTYAGNPIVLCGRPAYFNYSKSKSISRNLEIHHENPVNRILLITIINPQYPVTTDILHTIFSKQGHVLRIVIFRKSGLQAMVEFATNDQAQQAKQTLNGADIYTGCNTLKIEFSRQTTALNVYKNDEETFDYTEDKKVSVGLLRPPVKEGLLSRPAIRPFRGRGGMMMFGPRPPMHPPQMAGGCVLMVYGLDAQKMNCDRLFNILCCYGNVIKIKYLLNKPGAAMVEMGDHIACNTVIQCLGGVKLFDNKLEFSFSKQKYLMQVQTIADLPDGTPCFKDYNESKNHRFWTPQQSTKNRIFSPTKVLHFFNAPPDMTAERVKEIFTSSDVETPIKAKVFPEATRSASGLLEWNDISQALEALAVCNHHVIRDPAAKSIFTVKLAFSSMSSAN